jgi:chloride channel protein, CIC family
MRPFPAPLPVPAGSHAADAGSTPPGAPPIPAILGQATGQGDPQAVYAGESLALTLRQLAAYGRDGLPVLSADGRQVQGWITNASVLRAVASQIGTSPPHATDGRASRQPGTAGGEPPEQLPGYQVLEFTIRGETGAAGRTLGSISLPAGSIPVSVLRDRILREPDPGLILAAGDRVSVLTPGSGAGASA